MYLSAINIKSFTIAQWLKALVLFVLTIGYPLLLRLYTFEPEGIVEFQGAPLKFYADTYTMYWTWTAIFMPIPLAASILLLLPRNANIGYYFFLSSVLIFQGLEFYYVISPEVKILPDYVDYNISVIIPLTFCVFLVGISLWIRSYKERKYKEIIASIEHLTREDLESLASHFVKIEQGIVSITTEHEERIWKQVLLKYVNNGYRDISTKLKQLEDARP